MYDTITYVKLPLCKTGMSNTITYVKLPLCQTGMSHTITYVKLTICQIGMSHTITYVKLKICQIGMSHTITCFKLMHQSFVAPAPSGPRNSGAFNFSIFKALLKALHCRAKFVVKSPLKAPAPGS